MKTPLQIVLICFAGSTFAQNLPLPARDTNAPTQIGFRAETELHRALPLQFWSNLLDCGMKMSSARIFLLPALLVLIVVFAGACKTTPPVDWQARVGTYTYDQAVTELGPPDKQAKLTDGQTVAKWVTHRSGGTGFSVGTGFFSGGGSAVGVGVSQSTGYSDKVLTLTFGVNNVLTSWSKNY